MITNKPDPALGLIETMLLIDGVVVDREAHLERLERSTIRLYDRPLPAELHGAMELALQSFSLDRAARLRVTVWPTAAGLGCRAEVEPAERHLFTPLPGTGLRLRPVRVAGGLGAHKWRDRRLIEELGAGLKPEEEIVITDDDGEVLETGAGNFLAVFADRITTPPADHRLLPGVTRARVLELARTLGLHAEEHPVLLTELPGATEVFVTSAVRGLVPVIECGENAWPVGDVALRLRRKLAELWSSLHLRSRHLCRHSPLSGASSA
ncbi:MAG: aminotransferase class IV [Actinomycetota bacterium]|nr:aminotransferase class IV [Actinomycetota bacterium]